MGINAVDQPRFPISQEAQVLAAQGGAGDDE
jgi:hypothetical protein